jgi:hypothetical protein
VLPSDPADSASIRVSGTIAVTRLPVRPLPWWLFRLLSPFNETLREVYRTRPLWQEPIQLDNTKLVRFLGKEPHTPLETVVESTLRGMGCLNEQNR